MTNNIRARPKLQFGRGPQTMQGANNPGLDRFSGTASKNAY